MTLMNVNRLNDVVIMEDEENNATCVKAEGCGVNLVEFSMKVLEECPG